MPTYGSQLLGRGNRVNYVEPNLEPIYAGYDARQTRHDATQRGYAQYVDNVVKSDTLDPVEKKRRLDSLQSKVNDIYGRYNGNLSDAKDEFINTIIDNRKDPYWQADAQRTKAYRDLTSQEQQARAKGDIPLYRDASGNYISDYKDRFKSLTDEYGNYRPMTDYNIQTEKQLDYEAPLRAAFEQIKPNISNIVGRPVSNDQLSSMIGTYIASGTTGSTNPNIDRAIAGVVENYMNTPEWKQLSGRYGEDAYGLLQKMTGNVANQYRYSQNKIGINSRATNMLRDNQEPPKPPNYIDAIQTKGKQLNRTLNLPKNILNKSGNIIDFKKSYPELSNVLDSGEISSFNLTGLEIGGKIKPVAKRAIQSMFASLFGIPLSEIKTNDINYSNLANSVLDRSSIKKPEGMTDTDFTAYQDKIKKQLVDAWSSTGLDLKDIKSDASKFKSSVDNMRKIDPTLSKLNDTELASIYNDIYPSGEDELMIVPANSSLYTKGLENILDNQDQTNDLLEHTVYKKTSDGWKTIPQSTSFGLDKANVIEKYARPDRPYPTIIDPELGPGMYIPGDDEQIFIPALKTTEKTLRGYNNLRNNVSSIQNPDNDKTYDTANMNGSKILTINTLTGPRVINLGDQYSKESIDKYIDDYYKKGYTNQDIVDMLKNNGLNSISFNDFSTKYFESNGNLFVENTNEPKLKLP